MPTVDNALFYHATGMHPFGGVFSYDMNRLILKDGSEWHGARFGATESIAGEVVFNTGMVGYVESLTDPSYAGQILVFTYPIVGSYGVPDAEYFESPRIQAAGLIVSEYSAAYSHQAAKQSLAHWLKRENIPALMGVDTRELTKTLRREGVMLGKLEIDAALPDFVDPNTRNLVAEVSCKKPVTYGHGAKKIIAIDCGMKENIVREFVRRGVTVKRVPWDYDFTGEEYAGLFVSNGPGNPTMCAATIARIQRAMADQKPILGICLGTQLLALAAGASTYKLTYGHRSQNQPALERGTGRCFITSQNHGYAVKADSLPRGWQVWFTNANDKSVEGIRHRAKPWRAVQFHPEAAPGPLDTGWVFDEFARQL